MELDGRVVLVTGGAKRIGRAIALRLARHHCRIALHYRTSADAAGRTAEECRAAGGDAVCFAADLADPQSAPRLVRDVLAAFGRLDVLISSASIFRPLSLETFSLDEWNRTLQVNLTAPLQLAHAAHEALRSSGGRIIHLTDAATGRAWPDHLAYLASKSALETLTRALARALAPQVNVVAIAPGIVEWPEDYGPEVRERLLRRVPLGRAGRAEDVASAVEFVLREGDYISGAVIPIDGGRHIV